MALMPPDGYPIASFEQLRAAIDRAPHDMRAALAVRNFLMEAQYYRSLVASGQMNQNQYLVALEELKQLQNEAAKKGFEFHLETRDMNGHRTVHRPSTEVARVDKPNNPFPDVHFTSHQRVGDETKDTYIEHVHEMFAGGYIDAEEHDARLKAMMLARTREEMEFLIQDLPKVPEKKKDVIEVTPEPKGKGRIRVDPLAGAMLTWVSLLGAITVTQVVPDGIGGIMAIIPLVLIAIVSSVCTVAGAIKKKK